MYFSSIIASNVSSSAGIGVADVSCNECRKARASSSLGVSALTGYGIEIIHPIWFEILSAFLKSDAGIVNCIVLVVTSIILDINGFRR